MEGAAAGQFLPAANDRIDITRVELQPTAAPAGTLGGDHRRAAAEKAVEHDVAARRAVEDRIGDHRHRLYRRVQRRQIAFAASGKGIGPGVSPNIGAVAPEAAELDIVAVPASAVLEDKDELVLAAVERSHPSIVLDPDAEVFQLAVNAAPGRHQLCDVAPIHADKVDRAVSRERRQIVESMFEKVGELGAVHLARSHRERAMMDRAEAARMAIDQHVVRRIGEHHRGMFIAEEGRQGLTIESATAQDAMPAEDPEVSQSAEWRAGGNFG